MKERDRKETTAAYGYIAGDNGLSDVVSDKQCDEVIFMLMRSRFLIFHPYTRIG